MTANTAARAADHSPRSAALSRSQTPASVVLTEPGSRTGDSDEPIRLRRVLLQLAAAATAVVVLVGLAGAFASRRIAQHQAVHEAAQFTDLVADSVVQPALTDAMATDPVAARNGLDTLIRSRVLSASLVRVKLWNPAGTVIYSDEPRAIGQTYNLDGGARAVLTDPRTQAEVSDLSRPENQFERPYGKLLEVYRPVWTPGGKPLLFETYSRYDVVSQRTGELWRGFSGIMVSSLIAIFVLLIPLVWTLFSRARRAQRQREAMMQRAAEASLDERRRIAATLHDGVVQELAALSFAVAGGAESAAARGDHDLAQILGNAGASVRASLGGMRSLLVDIYPPSLASAGVAAALRDLATTAGGRQITVVTDIDDGAAEALTPEQQEQVFRVAQEALRNVVKHADAHRIDLRLHAGDEGIVLTVADDGAGFDVHATHAEDHFGLRLMADAARAIDASLRVYSEPGEGTIWTLVVA